MSQLSRVRKQMVDRKCPALLVSDIVNVQWLTGFTGSSGIAVVTEDKAFFITDSRYEVQAANEVTEFERVIFRSPDTQIGILTNELQSRKITKLGFETSTRYDTWQSWTEKLDGVELIPAGDILPPLRLIKTPDEVEKIKSACAIADVCFAHVSRMVQAGVSEYDLALDIEFFIRRHSATLAFDVISVSGPNSAKPHGKPSERKLETGDFVTFDFGAKIHGYCSDLTRTVVVGDCDEKHQAIYDRVLEAQIAAIEALKPGANGKDVDSLVRKILDKDDLSQYFGHGLGHGLGREVHDGGSLAQVRDQVIEPGQVWTVEPGVYIEGWGGVRIEDDVVITDTGAQLLTHSPKELLVMG